MDEIRPKDGSFSKVENAKIEKSRIVLKKRGRKPGSKKTGGRQAGTPNKSTTKWSEILDTESFSVPVEAIRMFKDQLTPPNIKFQILQFLAQYTTPSLKSVETESEDNESQEPQSTGDILNIVTATK